MTSSSVSIHTALSCAYAADDMNLYWKLLIALEKPGDCITHYQFGTDYSLILETESFYTLVLGTQDLEALEDVQEHNIGLPPE